MRSTPATERTPAAASAEATRPGSSPRATSTSTANTPSSTTSSELSGADPVPPDPRGQGSLRFRIVGATILAAGSSLSSCGGDTAGPFPAGNRAPIAVGEIPPVYRDWRYASPYPEVAVWPYFHDPNRDSLAFTAVGSGRTELHITVADGFVTIHPSRSGTVTVTATDPGGLMAQQTFEFAETSPTPPVPRPGSIPPAPLVSRRIPSLQVFHGQSATVNLRRHFTDEPGRTFAATSSAPNTAAVSVSDHLLTIDGVNLGWAVISATAATRGGSTKQDFKVLVDSPAARANSAPVIQRGFAYRKVVPSGVPFVVDMSRYFVDPEGDALTYEAVPRGPVATFFHTSVPTGQVALSALSPTSIEVRGTKTGFLLIGLTATDPGGLSAGRELMVEITSPVGR